MATIALKKKAGELREQARAKHEELKAKVMRQAEGQLGDDETQMTQEEIAAEQKAITTLIDEAKSYEGVDKLDDIMGRRDLDPNARRIIDNNTDEGTGKKETPPFETIGRFLRTVRKLGGISEVINLEEPTQEQIFYLSALWRGATNFAKGEPVGKIATSGDEHDRSFKEFEEKALVGDNTGSAGRGDFLVPTEHMAELLRTMGEQQQFVNRARRIPMTRRTLDFPRLAQTTASDTRPMFSFAAVTKIGEAVQKPEREPVFEQFLLTAFKYAAYVEASDELLSDSIVGLPPVLVELLTSAIAYEFDRDGIQGAGGSTEPQGFIGSAAEYAEGRNTLNTVVLDDILSMSARHFGGAQSIWLAHRSILPHIGVLAQSNVLFWHRDFSQGVPGTILGLPLVFTDKCPVIGLKGDLSLVDPTFYLYGDLQRITVASSVHFQFRNDITAWRAIFRAAGAPWPAGTFSHESSGSAKTWEVSPFVVLRQTVVS